MNTETGFACFNYSSCLYRPLKDPFLNTFSISDKGQNPHYSKETLFQLAYRPPDYLKKLTLFLCILSGLSCQVKSLYRLGKMYQGNSVTLPDQWQSRCSGACHLIPNCASEATKESGVARCGYVETVMKGISEIEQECSVCFPWISQGWKTVMWL